jgi:NADPH-dependent curcumin reductase CurA
VRALGFDAAIDYTKFSESVNAEQNFRAELKEHAPNGIDMCDQTFEFASWTFFLLFKSGTLKT